MSRSIALLALLAVSLATMLSPPRLLAQEGLPAHVLVDLEMEELRKALVSENHREVLSRIDAIRRIDAALADGELRFFEAWAAIGVIETARAQGWRAGLSGDQSIRELLERAELSLVSFFTTQGRDSARYNDALGLQMKLPELRQAVAWQEERLLQPDWSQARHTVLRGHTENVWGVDLSVDGRRILTVSADNTARLWDAATGDEVRWWDKSDEDSVDATLSSDGRRLAMSSGSYDDDDWSPELGLWNAETGEQIGDNLTVGEATFWFLREPDDRLMVVSDGMVRFFSSETGEEIGNWTIPFDWSAGVVYSEPQAGKLLAWNYYGGESAVFDVASGAKLATWTWPWDSGGVLASVRLSFDGRRMAAREMGNGVDILRLVDAETGADLSDDLMRAYGSVPTFSVDGRLFGAVSDDFVRVWDAESGALVSEWLGGSIAARSLAFSPTAFYLATSSSDYSVRIWDLETRDVVARYSVDHGARSLQFSADGRTLVGVDNENNVLVWSVD